MKNTHITGNELMQLRAMLSLYNNAITPDLREEAGEWLHAFYDKYGTCDPTIFKELVR